MKQRNLLLIVLHRSQCSGNIRWKLLDISPTSISIGMKVDEITLGVRETYKFQAILNQSYEYANGITWTSSSPSVVSVDQDGNVKAMNAGNTIIRAKLGNGQEAKALVQVIL